MASALEIGPVDAFPFVEPPTPRAIAGTAGSSWLIWGGRRAPLTLSRPTSSRAAARPRIGRIVIAARDRGCAAGGAGDHERALGARSRASGCLNRAQAADHCAPAVRRRALGLPVARHLWQFTALAGREALTTADGSTAAARFVNHLRMRWRTSTVSSPASSPRRLDAGTRRCRGGRRRPLPRDPRVAHSRASCRTSAKEGRGQRRRGAARPPPPLPGRRPRRARRVARGGLFGPRGLRFHLHPGSGLAKKGGRWILAAELVVETTRLYASCALRAWIEAAAGGDARGSDPSWDAKPRRSDCVASACSLDGLAVASRPVSLSALDPAAAHEVFVREASCPARSTSGAFLPAYNRKLVAEIAELEHKARRQDVLVDDEALAVAFYERVPKDVCTTASFERWRVDAVHGAIDPVPDARSS